MFPLRDDQPTFSTPFITYFLIAINLVIYFFEWQIGLQNHGSAVEHYRASRGRK